MKLQTDVSLLLHSIVNVRFICARCEVLKAVRMALLFWIVTPPVKQKFSVSASLQFSKHRPVPLDLVSLSLYVPLTS